MKSIWGLGLIAIFGITVFSCLDEPQYSEIPNIEFEKIVFKDIKDASSADSLIISLKFRDGNGDMGIDPTETSIPFNGKYYYVYNKNNAVAKIDFLPSAWSNTIRYRAGSLIIYASKYWISLINNNASIPGTDNTWEEVFIMNYKSKRTNPNYDTLPAFVKPYNCTNWEVVTQDQKVLDTLYFELNQNYNNIFITFQQKDNTGNFQDYDWTDIYKYPLCEVNGFNGRFPILSKDLSQPSTLEGTIRYAMVSTGFNAIFSIRTLRLKIKIQDRALNKSNEIFTPEFTLKSIPG